MRRRGLIAGLLTVAALVAVAVAASLSGAAAAPGAQASGSKVFKVKVADDFFSPAKKTIKAGTKVKWKWDGANTNPHNVTLVKGPKRVNKKKLTSATGSIGIKFNRTLKKKGTYKFICTIHATVMKQTIKVKK